ncbi:uncharacterized protein I303_102713 [Kwoniella dejecticola CBS 10117]|uniref:Uncharacterized protein n=1 Tax=Kwoniella dejecticola CBS 10117 TaxID=1296121 RepID=A0AAJ8KLB6_9TREE
MIHELRSQVKRGQGRGDEGFVEAMREKEESIHNYTSIKEGHENEEQSKRFQDQIKTVQEIVMMVGIRIVEGWK